CNETFDRTMVADFSKRPRRRCAHLLACIALERRVERIDGAVAAIAAFTERPRSHLTNAWIGILLQCVDECAHCDGVVRTLRERPRRGATQRWVGVGAQDFREQVRAIVVLCALGALASLVERRAKYVQHIRGDADAEARALVRERVRSAIDRSA